MENLFISRKQIISGLFIFLTSGCAKTNFVNEPAAPNLTSRTTKTVTSTDVVSAGNNKVDFLLVLDDSNSMLPDLKKLSARMSTFIAFLELSQIDWQMCVTTTRASSFGNYLPWNEYIPSTGTPNFVLAKGTPNLSTVFTSTIDRVIIGEPDSGDERALNSTLVSFRNAGPCYRAGAAVSVIAISDEDERSVGGDNSKVKPTDGAGSLKALEPEDLPASVLAQAHQSFGAAVRFTFNSIIVKPNDKRCEQLQDADNGPSHPAYNYLEMSNLTDGGVGSICDTDYSASLNTFKDKVVNSLGQLSLQCEPVKDTLFVAINHIPITNFHLDKNILRFKSELLEGTQIDLTYECKE